MPSSLTRSSLEEMERQQILAFRQRMEAEHTARARMVSTTTSAFEPVSWSVRPDYFYGVNIFDERPLTKAQLKKREAEQKAAEEAERKAIVERITREVEAFAKTGMGPVYARINDSGRLYVFPNEYSSDVMFTVTDTTLVLLKQFDYLKDTLKAVAQREGLAFAMYNRVTGVKNLRHVLYFPWKNAPEVDDRELVNQCKPRLTEPVESDPYNDEVDEDWYEDDE